MDSLTSFGRIILQLLLHSRVSTLQNYALLRSPKDRGWNGHRNIIHSSPKLETTQMPINKCMTEPNIKQNVTRL